MTAGSVWECAGRWLTFRFEPETAHRMAIAGLKSGALPVRAATPDPRLAVTAAGLTFPNPLGMAAGFDKDAEVPDELLGIGFGFAEIGTTTPKPQPGNPRPRIFRLTRDHAVINRLGFNNQGHDAAFGRLAARRGRGVVGVNIGANKDAGDRIADYVTGLRRFYTLASYFTINISSPNTPGLRDLQGRAQLAELLSRIGEARAAEEEIAQTGRAGVPEDRARHHRGRARRHRRRGHGQGPRRHDRLQHDACRGRGFPPIPAKRAACPGNRCSSGRPSSSPRRASGSGR